MKLQLHERVVLLQLLPREGDYAAVRTIRRAREMLSISPEEQKFYEFVEEKDDKGGIKYNWNADRDREQVKDCPIDEYTTDVVRAKLSEMNHNGKLMDEHISLFDKFVTAYQ